MKNHVYEENDVTLSDYRKHLDNEFNFLMRYLESGCSEIPAIAKEVQDRISVLFVLKKRDYSNI